MGLNDSSKSILIIDLTNHWSFTWWSCVSLFACIFIIDCYYHQYYYCTSFRHAGGKCLFQDDQVKTDTILTMHQIHFWQLQIRWKPGVICTGVTRTFFYLQYCWNAHCCCFL